MNTQNTQNPAVDAVTAIPALMPSSAAADAPTVAGSTFKTILPPSLPPPSDERDAPIINSRASSVESALIHYSKLCG